jgi:high-affinity nickel-transport protein
MGELLMIGTASLLLGMRHAADPDHVLAVATIVSRERSIRRAARVGMIWGLGHGITLALIGGSVIVFRVALSHTVELSLEFAVALMLILLGGLTLVRKHSEAAALSTLRPLTVGFVHGMAGSAAASVLVLSTASDVRLALVYLLVFGIGTLLGMAVMTSVLASPSLLAARKGTRTQAVFRALAGALTLVFGVYLAYRIGVVDGLLL